MRKSKEQIIAEKEDLANKSFEVAKEALEQIETLITTDLVSIKDLVSALNSSIKINRETNAELVELCKTEESKSEATLAVNYQGKVGELISKMK